MADVHSSLMDDADIRMRDGKITPSSEIHHLTSSPSQDGDEEDRIRIAKDMMVKMEQPELILDMEVAAVEVVTASKQPRRGRGRPRINKDTEDTADAKPRVKRPYKKRGSKATADPVPKAKRKYVRKQRGAANDKSGVEKIKDKDKEKEKKEKKEKEKEKKEKEKKEKVKKVNEKKERRKKVTEEKKPRQKKPRKTPAKKVKQLIQPLTPAMINARQKFNDEALSDNSEDSVVFCQEFRPPDVNNHSRRLAFVPDRDLYPDGIRPAENNLLQGKPPKTKSKPSGRESPIVSRLEDSSSGNSNSSSNSDTSDSDSSNSTDDDGDNQSERRKMDAEDRLSGDGDVYNGISSRLSASPDRSQSSSDTDSATSTPRNEGRKRNGTYRSGTPPQSPSSASSENADKSFQCHTCRKWFSSTVTLRIHKRSHVSRSGNGSSGALSSGGGGQRSSRRYECDCCDATFTRRERLEQHRSQVHKGALTERCEVCGRGFEDEEQQRRHTALHTPDERAGRCGECGEVVNGWEELRRHRAAHAPTAAHACPLCRKAFTYPHSLSRHLLNHSKAVYKCVVCKTSFSDADSLAKHLNSHLDRYKQLKT